MAKGSLRICARHGAYHSFMHPIYPADFATREELMDAVRTAIASGLAGVDANLRLLGLLLNNRVVAVIQQSLAHGVGIAAIGKRPDLHMDQAVVGSRRAVTMYPRLRKRPPILRRPRGEKPRQSEPLSRVPALSLVLPA